LRKSSGVVTEESSFPASTFAMLGRKNRLSLQK